MDIKLVKKKILIFFMIIVSISSLSSSEYILTLNSKHYKNNIIEKPTNPVEGDVEMPTRSNYISTNIFSSSSGDYFDSRYEISTLYDGNIDASGDYEYWQVKKSTGIILEFNLTTPQKISAIEIFKNKLSVSSGKMIQSLYLDYYDSVNTIYVQHENLIINPNGETFKHDFSNFTPSTTKIRLRIESNYGNSHNYTAADEIRFYNN